MLFQARDIIPTLEQLDEENKSKLELRVPNSILNEDEIDIDLLDLLPEENENNSDPDYETKVPIESKQIETKVNKAEEHKEVKENQNTEHQCYYCCQMFLRSAIEDHMRYCKPLQFHINTAVAPCLQTVTK